MAKRLRLAAECTDYVLAQVSLRQIVKLPAERHAREIDPPSIDLIT
jgi:hypothetical protein